MAKIVSCINLKGGVGKTALAVNMAAYYGSNGLKTLLIDLDPQTNATFSCITVDAWKEHAKNHGSVLPFTYSRVANFPSPLAPITNRCVARVAPT